MEIPRELGYRLPAEWEPQQGVWLSWPTDRTTWPETGIWNRVQKTFAELALRISQRESVYINLSISERMGAECSLSELEDRLSIKRGDIQFFDHPTNDVWVRDHGPLYLKHKKTGELALTDWEYNGWGAKYPYSLDNRIPSLVQVATGLDSFRQSLILEGGSVETNGVGDLLVTRDCLLNQKRNPAVSKEEIETVLKENLGVEKVHWMEGCIEGDDTDGHIDNLVRFFKTDSVLVAAPSSPEDTNVEMLHSLEEQSRDIRLHNGSKLEVVLLPLPNPILKFGKPLPLSYLNFFIGNGALFVPVYDQAEPDKVALEILSKAFPEREIVPICCVDLITEGGALHCLTQQVPQTV